MLRIVHNLDFMTYGRVEETSTDTEEYPNIDRERKPECQRDVHQRRYVHTSVRCSKKVVGSLRCCKCEEEKQERADELAQERDE